MAYRFDCTLNPGQCRARLQGWQRRALRGDSEAFASLAAPYLDLITEYLTLCGVKGEEELRVKIRDILHENWRLLPFANKVTEFERLLATVLFSVRLTDNAASCSSVIEPLTGLDPRSRFAFLARDFEDWDYAATAATLRITRKDLDEILISVRCRLLGVDLRRLDKPTVACIRKLSLDFDGRRSRREKKKLSCELGLLPEALDFKSRWLDLRCQLIEFRQEIRLSDEDKAELLENVAGELQSVEMIRVPFLERFVNRFTARPASVTSL